MLYIVELEGEDPFIVDDISADAIMNYLELTWLATVKEDRKCFCVTHWNPYGTSRYEERRFMCRYRDAVEIANNIIRVAPVRAEVFNKTKVHITSLEEWVRRMTRQPNYKVEQLEEEYG